LIRRQRPDETQFRHGAGGREPLSPPGQAGDHVHYTPMKRAGLGCITSRDKKPTSALSFFEVLAWELSGAGDVSKAIVPGCTVRQAKQLFDEGLI
jgi:hypothetical protein